MLDDSLCFSGSLVERTKRLFSIRGKTWDEIDNKIKDPKAKRS